MSLKNEVVLLLRKGRVSSVHVSDSRRGKTAPDLNIPNNILLCGFETLWYHSLSCLSRYVYFLSLLLLTLLLLA